MVGKEKMKIEELTDKLQNVFPMPQILAKILKTINDPGASSASVELVFKYEPSFTLKLLTLANSAYYGSPGKITNIRAAITLLGFNLVKSIAVHASVNEFFNFGSNNSIFSGYDLWKHSVGVGVCAKMISRRLHLGNAEDFFTLGILHDVGLIIEYQFYRDEFVAILSKLQNGWHEIVELEQEFLGVDHTLLAKMICDKWQMPESLGEIIVHHHQPLHAPEGLQKHACAMYVANHIVKKCRYGFYYGKPEPFVPGILERLEMEAVDVEVLQEDFEQEINELAMFFE
ncbi:HDOD domain-containing protein [bacterium]|nr:HDOD domain-containing protein [bacterium]